MRKLLFLGLGLYGVALVLFILKIFKVVPLLVPLVALGVAIVFEIVLFAYEIKNACTFEPPIDPDKSKYKAFRDTPKKDAQ